MEPAATSTKPNERVRAAFALGLELNLEELVELQRSSCDGDVLDILQEDPAVAASHPDLAIQVHEYLTSNGSAEVKLGAAFHPSVSDSDRMLLLRRLPSVSGNTRLLDSAAHRWLARSLDIEHRQAAAMSVHAPTEVLSDLACDVDDGVRLEVAKNPNSTKEILLKLAAENSDRIRVAVIRNCGADAEVVETVAARLKTLDLISCAVYTPTVITRIVEHFGWSSQSGVHASLGVAGTRVALRKVQFRESHQLTLWDGLVGIDYDPTVRVDARKCLATNESLTEHVALRMATEGCSQTRRVLAHNPAITEAVQRTLFTDVDPMVSTYLAGNPSISESLRDATIERALPGAVAWLARNRGASEDALQKLRPFLPENELLCHFLAVHPRTPAEILEELAGNQDQTIRRRVAGSFGASYPLRTRLANDPDEDVANEAVRPRSLPHFVHPIDPRSEWYGKASLISGGYPDGFEWDWSFF